MYCFLTMVTLGGFMVMLGVCEVTMVTLRLSTEYKIL